MQDTALNPDNVADVATSAFDSPLVQLGVTIVIIIVAAGLLRRLIAGRVRDADVRYKSRKVVSFVGYAAVFIAAVTVFRESLGGLSIAFGVAGAGVAFALQEVIASIAGWLALVFGGFFKVGDRVELGGIKGDVIDIGILRTTLMQIGDWVHGDQYNGRIVRVANSFVFKEPVFNFSADFPFLWDEIVVPIKYGSDHKLARTIIDRVAEEVVGDYAHAAEAAWKPVTRRYLIEAASVRPTTTMVATSNWIEFTLRYVVEYKRRRTTTDQLFTRLLEEIDASDGRVGIAAATLNIEKMPPVEVNLHRNGEKGA